MQFYGILIFLFAHLQIFMAPFNENEHYKVEYLTFVRMLDLFSCIWILMKVIVEMLKYLFLTLLFTQP